MAEFLAKNQPTPGDIFYVMCLDGCLLRYPNTIKLFKFALWVSPATSEVERGFSTMNLLVPPLLTSLNDANVDRLICTCIDGTTNFSDNELEQIVNIFRDSNNIEIVLWRLFYVVVFIGFFAAFLFFDKRTF